MALEEVTKQWHTKIPRILCKLPTANLQAV